MKTDDLIAALAADLPQVQPRQIERDMIVWMIPSSLLVLGGVLFWLGLRGDLIQAVTGPTFWAKATYTTVLTGSSFWLLSRLGRPGRSVVAPAFLLAATVAVVAVLAIAEQMSMTPDARMAAMLGVSSNVCLTNILGLSLLAAPFIFFAARRYAPTRPMLAGAVAGLLTAALATTLYGLHCPERTATFVALWYTGGIALAALAGAVIGRFALRW